MSKTIVITGASRGFGRLWAEALLERGDKVVATARKLSDLDDLVAKYGENVLALQLDVNSRTQVFDAVEVIKTKFGRIDTLINNAGYGLFGAIEETSEAEARAQFETNFFGLLWMTQAVLPIMRAQNSGHIIQVSSFLGLVALPILGLYNASKFAVEGLSETLAAEVKPFNINISLIEPNGFSTDWGAASAFRTIEIEAYDGVRKAFSESATPDSFGNPVATVTPILNLIDSPQPPLRLLLGKIAFPAVKRAYEEKIKNWEAFADVSAAAHG